ncbi:hypothetical protein Py17XNL_000704190 [Plasmodium yoelii yoelii]|uniref:Uncharacterized protein n=1 Tax=Plasmodium yoelii yoelii TaxID=73239 RepID=A0AAE9WMF2_PLAYO|nr:hypothetical protein Py17XNL_000704190 [Plasmodium yoelii yoelii]
MEYVKNVELKQSKKDIIINIDKSGKTNNNNNNNNNKNNKNIANLSFYNLIKQYDELINNLVNLYNNHIDIYIEFLYILIINTNLFNHFLYICTYDSGNKYNSLLSLIHKHFITIIKYYHFYNSHTYCNYFCTKFKNLCNPRAPKKGTGDATRSTSDGDLLHETSKKCNKKCNDISDSYMSLSSENIFSKIKNNEYKKVGVKICSIPIQNEDTNKNEFSINKNDFDTNKNDFDTNKYFKLKKIMLIFEKLTNEHLYILLYFSLSILPTIFHTYLTIKFSKKKKNNKINSYLINTLRQIKFEITNTLTLKTKKNDFSKFNTNFWNYINNINLDAINKKCKNCGKCENYISTINNKMKMLHTLEFHTDLMTRQDANVTKGKRTENVRETKRDVENGGEKNEEGKEGEKNAENGDENGGENGGENEEGEDVETLEQLLKDKMQVKNIYKYIKKKKYTYNCKGFENIIKSVSIIIEYNIYSFFINKIGMSNYVGKNNLIINNLNIYDENNNYIIVRELKKDNTLIHNEYIKKKIKKNKIYTYKILNNKIEALLNTKEFMENIKKEKGNKYEKDKKKKLDFFYIGTENNNDCNIINNQNNIYDDIFKCFKKKTNTDILESDIDSYKDSNSSENLIFYEKTKKYFYKNKLNIDYFTYFITTSFYIFIHFHNIYFSSTFFNIFLTFSIKLAYKYTHNTNYLPSSNLTNQDNTSPEISPGKPRETKLNNKRFYKNIKKDEMGSETVPLVKIPMNNFLEKYQNIKKKKKKKLDKLGYKKNDNYFTNKKSLLNTFEIIVNSFLDVCISLCSINFKCIHAKHNLLNKKYILNNIYYYNKVISKGYDEIELYNHDLQNYKNFINGYLLYFSELKKSELFKNAFINNGQARKRDEEKEKKEKKEKKESVANVANVARIDGPKLAENGKQYEKPHLERNHINMNKEKEIIKRFIENGCIYDKECKDSEEDISSDNCDILLSNYSDKSLIFLKKCKNKIKKRIYINENSIINLLMNIGCLFMNNIKYNSRFVFKILDKMKKNVEISKNKDKFFNYMHTVFFSVYNNNNVEKKKKKKKNLPFLNIYNQYFLSFFFFYKIHYIFFLIKLKSEKELYLRSYWLLYAVYNITQEF